MDFRKKLVWGDENNLAGAQLVPVVIFREHSDESQYYLKWGVFLQRK
jgi:hypothetical protein